MKLSGKHKAILLAAALSVFDVAFAQQGVTDEAAQAQEDASGAQPAETSEDQAGRVVILHFEPPVALDVLEQEPLLGLSDAFAQQPADQSDSLDSVFANLGPEEQAYLRRLQDIENYEQALEELEFEGGAWSVQIAEELTTLGTLLHQQGDYEESIEVFDRAVHINRVNHGLYSPEQVPLIQRRVESHIALGQWKEADEQQQYAFYVQTKAYGARDPRMIAVFENLARWNISFFHRGIDPDPTPRLMQTFQLYRAAADTVAAHFGTRDPRYIQLLRDTAGASDMVNRYSLAGSPAGTNVNPNIRMVDDFAGGSRRPQGGTSGGERALLRIVDFYSDPELPATEENLRLRAVAMAELGDWYLLRERRQAAMRTYNDAYDLLMQAENGDVLVQELFGDIAFLPTFSTFDEEKKTALGLDPDNGARQGYIDMSFDVSQYGRAANFELLAMEPPDLRRVEMQVIEKVRATLLRPRIVEGRSVASEGERYRFAFWY